MRLSLRYPGRVANFIFDVEISSTEIKSWFYYTAILKESYRIAF